MSRDAWRALADALAPPATEAPSASPLGGIQLLPHQREAVVRLEAQLDAHGIALLADDTGLGKTYVACALARSASHPLVVAPAAVRAVWHEASRRTDVPLSVVSHEALSRGATVTPAPDFVIIDEAHHARSPGTRRWQALAVICRSARVLLVSATPMHNAPRELAALFALRLGSEADRALAAPHRYVVRRTHRELAGTLGAAALPDVAPWRWHPAPEHAGIADALAALPPALPPVDGREAAPLWRLGLVRAWASSDAALRSAVRRRLARGLALEQAVAEGRPLTRAALARWTHDDVVQPTLALDAEPPVADASALSAVVAAHIDALGGVLRILATSTADAQRAASVAATLQEDPDARAVLFCSYSATADAYWQQFRHRAGTALASGGGGRIASGPVARAELFAAMDGDAPTRRHRRDQVRLLIATDVASEGLSLTAASIVWHADLPWTPARLAQRTGRLARLGAPHARVSVHAFAPPAATADTLALRQRLDAKAHATRDVAPSDVRLSGIGSDGPPTPLDVLHRLRERAEQWASAAKPPSDRRRGARAARDAPPVAVGIAPRAGSIVVLGTGASATLWSFADDAPAQTPHPDPSPQAAWGLLRDATPCALLPHEWPVATRRAVRRAEHRLARAQQAARASEHMRGELGGDAAPTARFLRHLGDALRLAPPDQRGRAAPIAAALRQRLAQPTAAGWHASLLALAARPPDRRWWDDAAELAAALQETPPVPVLVPRPAVTALLVLVVGAEPQ